MAGDRIGGNMLLLPEFAMALELPLSAQEAANRAPPQVQHDATSDRSFVSFSLFRHYHGATPPDVAFDERAAGFDAA